MESGVHVGIEEGNCLRSDVRGFLVFCTVSGVLESTLLGSPGILEEVFPDVLEEGFPDSFEDGGFLLEGVLPDESSCPLARKKETVARWIPISTDAIKEVTSDVLFFRRIDRLASYTSSC